MNRWFLPTLLLTAVLMSVGCCGPMGCGVGCNTPSCNDCEGAYYGDRIIPARPLDGLRQLRKQMVCGSGCGGVYVGEWISTPPDCEDPCCGEQWIGGATKARFGCWQPGFLLRNLYGSRFCTDEQSSTPCGCGEITCGGDCGFVETLSPSMGISSDCGCAGTSATSTVGSVVHRSVPATDNITRSARQTMSQAGRLR